MEVMGQNKITGQSKISDHTISCNSANCALPLAIYLYSRLESTTTANIGIGPNYGTLESRPGYHETIA
jgi:hypothetical protein